MNSVRFLIYVSQYLAILASTLKRTFAVVMDDPLASQTTSDQTPSETSGSNRLDRPTCSPGENGVRQIERTFAEGR